MFKILQFFAGDEEVAKYKRFRNIGRFLNSSLIQLVPRDALDVFGRRLGLIRGNSLVVEREDELAVLFDHIIHNYRRDGKNIVERYLDDTSPAEGSDEAMVLRAMIASTYSIFEIEEILPRKGAILNDIVRRDSHRLIDIGIGTTGAAGGFLAGRLIPLPEFCISSGTFIPLRKRFMEKKVLPLLKQVTGKSCHSGGLTLSRDAEETLSTQIIRAALHAGALERTAYVSTYSNSLSS
jgi:hypothetical protein